MQIEYRPLRLPLGRTRKERRPIRGQSYEWTSVDPEENRFRYYSVVVQEDLWGERCLVLSWGRIHAKTQNKYIWAANEADLDKLIDSAFELRRKHHYLLRG